MEHIPLHSYALSLLGKDGRSGRGCERKRERRSRRKRKHEEEKEKEKEKEKEEDLSYLGK